MTEIPGDVQMYRTQGLASFGSVSEWCLHVMGLALDIDRDITWNANDPSHGRLRAQIKSYIGAGPRAGML